MPEQCVTHVGNVHITNVGHHFLCMQRQNVCRIFGQQTIALVSTIAEVTDAPNAALCWIASTLLRRMCVAEGILMPDVGRAPITVGDHFATANAGA